VDTTADLRVLIRSQYPLLVVEADEEQRFLSLLCRVAEQEDFPVWTWSAARGLARRGMPAQYRTADPRRALAFVSDLSAPGIFVFLDVSQHLTDPIVLRAVKDTAQRADPGQTIVLTAPNLEVPAELKGIAVPWRLRPPDENELARLVRRTLEDLSARGLSIEVDAEDDLVEALKGLTLPDAERILQRAVLRDGALTASDLPWVRAAKVELLNTDGVLEFVESETGTLDQVGGMEGLKKWLEVRGRAIGSPRARTLGIDPPRGMLLTGVPGCGKSLVAKTLAATWGRPLLLLDPARVYRKYVGESEQRLEAALRTADALAPAVLWIDEIEKGFATGGDADGGVSSRLLGTFLRWMQDRPDGLFIVATANDVAALPPEFLRKGRFDEVFFVDLPGPQARRSILEIQLSARHHDPGNFDLDKLTAATNGFSGAEIESVVVGALYRAFATNADMTTDELIAEAGSIVPLSVARAEDVERLRAWAETRAVRA
jgi:AAA+ superfamily predicted ATPase